MRSIDTLPRVLRTRSIDTLVMRMRSVDTVSRPGSEASSLMKICPVRVSLPVLHHV